MKGKNKKKVFISLLALFLGAGVFFLVAPANATLGDSVGSLLGSLIGWIIGALGVILVLVMQALVAVAQYSNFISSPAIMNGWKIVRDVCNMFFVLILLIIAFATILKIENYSYKKWLPKLILMAILINFSKTICGLLIDVAQVVMLTFVNAFKDMAAGNLVTNLGVADILTLADNSADVGFWAIVGAYVLGLIYVLIALVVVTTMLAMLVMRIIMIWIYVVLSPAAYLMSAFPGGQKYASQWWTEFSKNLIVGPVLAFFIWLSFVSLQTQDMKKDFPVDNLNTSQIAAQAGISGQEDTKSASAIGATNASTPDVFIRFIIAIGMLIGGLKISQEIGGAAGGIAGKGMAKISSGAAFAGGGIGGFALGKAKAAGSAVGGAVGRSARNQSLGVASLITKGVGSGINRIAGKNKNTKVGDALKQAGGIGLEWRSDMQAKNKKRKTDERQKFLEKIGMGEKSMDRTSEFLKTDSGKNFANVTGAVGTGASIGGAFGGLPGAAVGAGAGLLVSGAQALLGKLGIMSSKEGEEQKGLGNTKTAWLLNNLGEQASGAHSFMTDTTQRAAASGSKEIKNAKQKVNNAATDVNDFMKDSSSSTFYSTSPASQKKLFEQLTASDNPDSPDARNNIEGWVKGIDGNSSPHDLDTLRGLAKGIAAADKGGMDVSSLRGIMSAINSKSAFGDKDHGLNGSTVESYKNNVVAYRKTGASGEQGSGELAVNTFANNKDNVAGKNVVGVDFNKMEGSGLDVKAEASFASGDAMGPVVEALKNQINAEREKLNADIKNAWENAPKNDQGDAVGGYEEEHNKYSSRMAELDKAEDRLDDPEQVKELQLVNTGSANYGRQERMTSKYHEEIHAGGVEDENLTEGISKKLMENKFYGRNASSGGRHATEIAKLVKDMQSKGMGNDNIMAEVDKEIKSRLSMEGKSRAERVASLESGRKETESQSIAPGTAEEEMESADKGKEKASIDTAELQEGLDALTEKIQKSTSDFKLSSGISDSKLTTKGLADKDAIYQLKILNRNMRKIPGSISKLAGSKAPTTIMEASAINDETSS